MKTASRIALHRKTWPLLQLIVYAGLIMGAAYVVMTGLGVLGTSVLRITAMNEPRPMMEQRWVNTPLPPVIQPPADPTRDPRFANWALTREESIITLAPPSSTTDSLAAPAKGKSDSIITLPLPDGVPWGREARPDE